MTQAELFVQLVADIQSKINFAQSFITNTNPTTLEQHLVIDRMKAQKEAHESDLRLVQVLLHHCVNDGTVTSYQLDQARERMIPLAQEKQG